jgi:hypothetical protein
MKVFSFGSLVLGLLVGSASLHAEAAKVLPASSQPAVSISIAEIVKMHDTGVKEDVLKEYIKSSETIFQPRADDIIYLHDHGISSDVITAMIQRSAELRKNLPPAQVAAQPPIVMPAPQSPAPVQQGPVIVTQPPVQYPVVTPVYNYAEPYPVYIYPSYSYYPRYWSSWSFGSPYWHRPLYTHYGWYGRPGWSGHSYSHVNVHFGGSHAWGRPSVGFHGGFHGSSGGFRGGHGHVGHR